MRIFIKIIILLTVLFFQESNLFAQDLPLKVTPPDSLVVNPQNVESKTVLGKILQSLSPANLFGKKELPKIEIPAVPEIPPFNVALQQQANTLKEIKDLSPGTDYSPRYQSPDTTGITEKQYDSLKGISYLPVVDTKNILNYTVYGYHPFWMGTAWKSYNYSLLSRIAYFSYVLDPKTGSYKTLNNFNNTGIIEMAHKNGTKVDLCVTNFGYSNNIAFLSNPVAQKRFIDSVLTVISRMNADGINIDFEKIPNNQKDNFSKFIKNLSLRLHQTNVNYSLSIAIPAVDWNESFDITSIVDYTDLFILMGYDFYGDKSKTAGPNSVLSNGGIWSAADIVNSVSLYLNKGIPRNKFILALPYYGKKWITKSGIVPSESVGFTDAITYREFKSYYDGKYPSSYDTASVSKFFIFQQGKKWVQCWTDDEHTLAIKYDYIKKQGLAGVGIWALGFDNGYSNLWDLLDRKFTAKPTDFSDLQSKYDSLLVFHTDSILALDDSQAEGPVSNFGQTIKEIKTKMRNTIERNLRVFTLIISLLLFFSLIGFIISIFDCNVRYLLFNNEFRIYLFVLFIIELMIILMRLFGFIKDIDLVLIIGIIFGFFITMVIINVMKKRTERNVEDTP
ncbi:MAG: hypothetical protein K9J13_13810 [Saprospiraceae bacterium]|nr:hypothetical protein [Saprospiraceae bacterium]